MSRAPSPAFNSALYRGELMHARHDELARRAFRYPVFMAALDLDELPALDASLWLFSHRGRNVFAFDARDYAATLAPNTRDSGPSPHDPHDPRDARDASDALAALRNLRDGLA